MRVTNLTEGHLYAISEDPRICVILWKDNYIDIVKAIAHIGWRKDKGCLKGRPALYCGVTKIKSDIPKQGWWKAHRFLINGDHYNVHGDCIKNIFPFAEES